MKPGDEVKCWYPDGQPWTTKVVAVRDRYYGDAVNGLLVTVEARQPCACCGRPYHEESGKTLTLGHEWLDEEYAMTLRGD